MAREITIAATQLPNVRIGSTNADKRAHNLQTAEAWLDKAGGLGADVACVGEACNAIGLEITRENLRIEIEGAVEETIARLGTVARRHRMAVIAPIWGLVDGVPRNVALVLDQRGQCVGRYFKVHLTENERGLGLVPGDEWPVFDLDFGRIGIEICHDNSFPESARCLTLNGAEAIFWPHVMSGWGGEFMDVLLRSPAIHNGIHFVPVCYGCPPSQAWRPGMMIGRSSIIAPDGTILADAGRHPAIALARVDLDARRIAADFTRAGDYVWQVDMLNDRRPETYTPLVRPAERTSPVAPADNVEEAPQS